MNDRSKKYDLVKEKRGVSPEEVFFEGELLDIQANQNYPGQELYYFLFKNYVWVVPVDISNMKPITAWPSRKHKRRLGQ